MIVEWRRADSGLGPISIVNRLRDAKVSPLPGRSSVYRCLVRHNLVVPVARRRKREDYIRWERSKAMELWQMDIVGGVVINDAPEAKIVSGIDDHSRFIISVSAPPESRRCWGVSPELSRRWVAGVIPQWWGGDGRRLKGVRVVGSLSQ